MRVLLSNICTFLLLLSSHTGHENASLSTIIKPVLQYGQRQYPENQTLLNPYHSPRLLLFKNFKILGELEPTPARYQIREYNAEME